MTNEIENYLIKKIRQSVSSDREASHPDHKIYNPEFLEKDPNEFSLKDAKEYYDYFMDILSDRKYFEDSPEIVDISFTENPSAYNNNAHLILKFNTLPVDLDSAFNYVFSDHNGQYCVHLILDEDKDEGVTTVLLTLVSFY